jgi:hypothetical protein
MYRRTILGALGLLAATTAFAAQATTTDEAYACRNGARERRVELQHADAPDRLPCQVLYWRDGATPPDDGKSMWQADHDFGFCIERTRDLVQRLQEAGWKCQKGDGTTAEIQAIPALAPSGQPAGGGDRSQPGAAIPPGRLPAAEVDRTKLGEALTRDMQRLAQLTAAPGARFEIEATELGDLDQDGKADAAVLLNYQSDQPGTAQFLVVYRFDGKTFVPAAKTYVGGAGTDVLASGIEKIENGTIHLLLEVRQPGDLECCPSGRRSESYVLRNGALVPLRSES